MTGQNGSTHEWAARDRTPSARVSDRTMTHESRTENGTDASLANCEPQRIPEGRPEVSGPEIEGFQYEREGVFKLRERDGKAGAWVQCQMGLAVTVEEWR